MNTIVLYGDSVDIPDGISDLAGFRRWVHSDDFPDTGRICFLDGRVWVDMSRSKSSILWLVGSQRPSALGGFSPTDSF
jgi:hypothetical protein